MRGSIVALAILFLSSSAMADWVKVDSNDLGTTYVDPSTIRRSGSKVKMWDLVDFRAAQGAKNGQQVRSIRAQSEYDCEESAKRAIYVSAHAGNMANGNIVTLITQAGDWTPIAPESVVEAKWKIACKK